MTSVVDFLLNKWVQEIAQTGGMALGAWLVHEGLLPQSQISPLDGSIVFIACAALSIGEKLYARWAVTKK